MPTLKNLFFSSKSSRNSPKKQDSSDSGRLTRQRKLRHVSDGRLGLSQSERLPIDSPKPQPLPLPEIRRESGSERSFFRRSKEGTSIGEGDERDKRVDVKSSSSGFDRSSHSIQLDDKAQNYPTTKSKKSSRNFRRDISLSPDDRNDTRNFRLNVSAPTSPLSSPLLSPQRFNSVNFVPSNPQFLFSSTPNEIPNENSNNPKQKQGFESTNHHNIHPIDVPARSAPTSPLSRPLRNPQKFNSVNYVPSNPNLRNSDHFSLHSPKQKQGFEKTNHHNLNPTDIPARSAPTSPLSRTLRNPQKFNSVNIVPSNPNLRNSDHFSLHCPKRKQGFQTTNHHNLHPLPLPPSSPKKTKSPKSTSEKAEASSTKSPWVKGKLIGRGTYGSVFEAVNSETGAMCAMKEVDILQDDTKSVECIKQLEQEIKILQHLEHKNIVRYYGCEVAGDHFCIYLEYIHPGSINKYVRDHFGAMTESIVRNFTRHILSGLAYLHSRDTVHRDIKGGNLLVDASGTVKLADFGLAKHLTAAAADLSLKGSPHWMAPELLQAVMRKDSNPNHAYAIDIWSLGCTVIEMFNGKPPWSEFDGVQALFHVMHKSPDIPGSLSTEGKDFLNWCFKRNPIDRPTAAQLLKHPFVRTTKESGFSTRSLDFSAIKLSDSSCSPREQPNVYRSLPSSPFTRRPFPRIGGRFNRESSRRANRGSPCSPLESFPSISSPDFRNNSPATNSPKNLGFATRFDYNLNINRKSRKGFSRSFEGL